MYVRMYVRMYNNYHKFIKTTSTHLIMSGHSMVVMYVHRARARAKARSRARAKY